MSDQHPAYARGCRCPECCRIREQIRQSDWARRWREADLRRTEELA